MWSKGLFGGRLALALNAELSPIPHINLLLPLIPKSRIAMETIYQLATISGRTRDDQSDLTVERELGCS